MKEFNYAKGTFSLGSVVDGHQNIDITLPDGNIHHSVMSVVIEMDKADSDHEERDKELVDLADNLIFTMNKYDSMFAEAERATARMVTLAQGYEQIMGEMREAGINPKSLIPPKVITTLDEMAEECKEFQKEMDKEMDKVFEDLFSGGSAIDELFSVMKQILK